MSIRKPLSPLAGLLFAGLALASAGANAGYVLAPQWHDNGAPAAGADATFHRIDNDWHGSVVLWDEAAGRFGSGAPVGSFSWGTGLWGRADWDLVQRAGDGALAAPPVVQSWQGSVATIRHGNARFNECYGAALGLVDPLPLFDPAAALGDCNNAALADPAQTNWTARYQGYLRITEAAEYNFSVLNDDGFFFRLIGEGGSALEIGRDYLNPPARIGFGQTLSLTEGLYGFELGAWNRLGAGVVDLRWTTGCTRECEWSLVPADRLLSSAAVPEPGAFGLACFGLSLALAARRTRRRPPATKR
jgi:hypothetical protein